ncbi:hypothetical protein [Micromonospora sp. HUAS LYJ1]|uniref:hypothetical protein n=1 Tax=Micromonospora sp. HUAS LYJ1 TaxID=3061626 RepID=UPI002670E620|nr:hypothetical protein [Micromonospora sp. HUAS LYJ1]WKU07994.1 hypothetical protein Q2K16_13675 [Micromonospora sp. HUAS LYJ1]
MSIEDRLAADIADRLTAELLKSHEVTPGPGLADEGGEIRISLAQVARIAAQVGAAETRRALRVGRHTGR